MSIGEPVDERGPIESDHEAIRSTAPRQRSSTSRLAVETLETGIKVVDLIAPYPKGGKVGLFGGAGVGKTVVILELITNIAQGARRATRCSAGWVSARARATTSGTRWPTRSSRMARPCSKRRRSSTAR